MSKKGIATILKVLAAVMVMLFLIGCGTQIPSGHRGVKYFKFGDGTEMGKVYDEGFNWHLPWNRIYVYKIQLEERKEDLQILSSDGATIMLEVSIWYRPDVMKLDSLQKTIGPDYFSSIVAPSIRGVARGVVGMYKPEEIYSTRREVIAAEILSEMQELASEKFISVENVIIRNVVLPKRITDAINAKLAADQDQKKMEFILLKETQEAKRKEIEAIGIAKFQEIVSSGITKTLLKWKGIEATQELARSPNTKIIIIGSGADGLPIILGGDN